MSRVEIAEKFAASLGQVCSAKVWSSGEKVRVYFEFARGYQGGAGGGKFGHVELGKAALVKAVDWASVPTGFREAFRAAAAVADDALKESN